MLGMLREVHQAKWERDPEWALTGDRDNEFSHGSLSQLEVTEQSIPRFWSLKTVGI